MKIIENITFLAGILQQIIYNEPLSDNEMYSLSNIVDVYV